MRALLQRVTQAEVVTAAGRTGVIGAGLCVFLGVGPGDDCGEAEYVFNKIVNLRIFPDSLGRMNLSLKDSGGGLIVISQFTLYADTGRGNRPSFTDAAPPGEAEEVYKYFLGLAAKNGFPDVQSGVFGAEMKVSLTNDGPVTIMINGRKG